MWRHAYCQSFIRFLKKTCTKCMLNIIAVAREIKAEIFRNVLYGVFKENKHIFHSCYINMQENIVQTIGLRPWLIQRNGNSRLQNEMSTLPTALPGLTGSESGYLLYIDNICNSVSSLPTAFGVDFFIKYATNKNEICKWKLYSTSKFFIFARKN